MQKYVCFALRFNFKCSIPSIHLRSIYKVLCSHFGVSLKWNFYAWRYLMRIIYKHILLPLWFLHVKSLILFHIDTPSITMFMHICRSSFPYWVWSFTSIEEQQSMCISSWILDQRDTKDCCVSCFQILVRVLSPKIITSILSLK